MQPENLLTATDHKTNGRPAGIAIAMITFMAHHPLPSAHDTEHFIGELVHDGLAIAVVHGALIGTMGLLLFGFKIVRKMKRLTIQTALFEI